MPAINLAALVARYVRPFAKNDPARALQYIACICLTAEQNGAIGKEQIDYAWSEVRKLILLGENTNRDNLIGGFRPDGTFFVCLLSNCFPLHNFILLSTYCIEWSH